MKNLQDLSSGIEEQKNQLASAGYDDYADYQKKEDICDHTAYGLWQVHYGRMMDSAFSLENKHVLDIGCASGAMVQAFHECNAIAYGCDVDAKAIGLCPFKDIKNNIKQVETSDLSSGFDTKFDFIHSHQVFEHFPGKEYSEKVIEEIHSISKDTSLVYVSLVAGEHILYDQLIDMHKKGEDVDITHVNIWPMEYWIDTFSEHFYDVTNLFAPIINCYQYLLHDQQIMSYYKEYNWHQMVFSMSKNVDEMAYDRLKELLDIQSHFADKSIYMSVYHSQHCHKSMRNLIKKYIV